LTGNRGTGTYCMRERLIAPSEALRMSMEPESAPLLLLLADRNEISQMPQFHSDTLSRLV
jgi:hypothetical protein